RDSSGPAFFRVERVGKDGKHFRLWTFRTMLADADGKLPGPDRDHDRRLTRLGRRLRRSKLDQLPELLNVILGDMSLVGPRPATPEAVENYPPVYRRLFTVRPGIASPAFVVKGKRDAFGPDSARDAKTVISQKLALELR